jgi:WD40 repeat protein
MKTTSSVARVSTVTLLACIWVGTTNRLETAELLLVRSPDQGHLATVAEQGRIHYRNASDNTIQHTFYICHPRAISFSTDGKLLAAAGGRSGGRAKIKVWRVGDHQQLCEIFTAGEGINLLALSSDSRFVGATGVDGHLEMWRVSDGQTQWSRALSSAAKSIRFSSDSRRLLVSTENGGERQFDASNGRPLPEH